MLVSLADFEHVVEDAFPVRFGDNLAGAVNSDNVHDKSPLRGGPNFLFQIWSQCERRPQPVRPPWAPLTFDTPPLDRSLPGRATFFRLEHRAINVQRIQLVGNSSSTPVG